MNKRKLNITMSLILVGLMSTAYATCYLQKVVLCLGSGDGVGSFTSTCPGSPSYSANVPVYASENAYKWDVYSVTRGGYTSHAYSTAASDFNYCNRNSGQPDINNGTFSVWYRIPCNGVEVDTDNAFLGLFTFSGAIANGSQTPGFCN